MKNFVFVTISFALLILIASCGSDPVNHADSICNCLKEGGLNSSLSLMELDDLEDSMDEEEVTACVLNVFRKMEDDMSDMSKNDKKEYTKEFLKGVVDTECSDLILNAVPYDMLGLALTGAESELLRSF